MTSPAHVFTRVAFLDTIVGFYDHSSTDADFFLFLRLREINKAFQDTLENYATGAWASLARFVIVEKLEARDKIAVIEKHRRQYDCSVVEDYRWVPGPYTTIHRCVDPAVKRGRDVVYKISEWPFMHDGGFLYALFVRGCRAAGITLNNELCRKGKNTTLRYEFLLQSVLLNTAAIGRCDAHRSDGPPDQETRARIRLTAIEIFAEAFAADCFNPSELLVHASAGTRYNLPIMQFLVDEHEADPNQKCSFLGNNHEDDQLTAVQAAMKKVHGDEDVELLKFVVSRGGSFVDKGATEKAATADAASAAATDTAEEKVVLFPLSLLCSVPIAIWRYAVQAEPRYLLPEHNQDFIRAARERFDVLELAVKELGRDKIDIFAPFRPQQQQQQQQQERSRFTDGALLLNSIIRTRKGMMLRALRLFLAHPEYGFDINAVDDYSWSALCTALGGGPWCHKDQSAVARLLLENGAKVMFPDDKRPTGIHAVRKHGSTLVDVAIDRGWKKTANLSASSERVKENCCNVMELLEKRLAEERAEQQRK